MNPFRLALDFDDTLCRDERHGLPMVEVAKRIKEEFGDQVWIVVWSARNSSEEAPDDQTRLLKMAAMKMFLDVVELPYDEIDWGDQGKMVADMYVDDRAYRPVQEPLSDYAFIKGEIERVMDRRSAAA